MCANQGALLSYCSVWDAAYLVLKGKILSPGACQLHCRAGPRAQSIAVTSIQPGTICSTWITTTVSCLTTSKQNQM